MTSAPSSEGASTPEESYAETTPLGVKDVPDDKPVVPKKAGPARARPRASGRWATASR